MRRAVALLLAGTVGGCYDLVSPAPNARPSFNASLTTVHSDSSRYRLAGSYQRGTDDVGRFSGLADLGIHVNGVRVAPEPSARITAQSWAFAWALTAPPSAERPDRVRVSVPETTGMQGSALEFTVPVPRPAGALEVNIPRGFGVQLAVEPLARPAGLSPVIRSWRLAVARSCAGELQGVTVADGIGAYPLLLTIHGSHISSAGRDDLEVCLTVHTVYEPPGAPYRVRVSSLTLIEWRVRVH